MFIKDLKDSKIYSNIAMDRYIYIPDQILVIIYIFDIYRIDILSPNAYGYISIYIYLYTALVLVPIMAALRHNKYFRGIMLQDITRKEIITLLADVLR